jgi:hypothetical protein
MHRHTSIVAFTKAFLLSNLIIVKVPIEIRHLLGRNLTALHAVPEDHALGRLLVHVALQHFGRGGAAHVYLHLVLR